jgi:hypothetical protein
LPDTVKFFFAWRLPFDAKLKLSIMKNKPKSRKIPGYYSENTLSTAHNSRRTLKNPGNRLNVLYVVFCKLSNDVRFCKLLKMYLKFHIFLTVIRV